MSVTEIARAKWSTKVKIWLGTIGAGIPILLALFAGVQWINQNVAWAEELKKSYVLQTIQVSQLRTEDRMWKIRHDLKDIDARKNANMSWPTDAGEREQLLNEYTFLLEQKQKWDSAEKDAAQ